jgi:Domain of unknown function (DUF4868)
MNLKFSLDEIKSTEFGIGLLDDQSGPSFTAIPVDRDVKAALREMAADTWRQMRALTTDPAHYEASEKYESLEYVYLESDDPIAAALEGLHSASNIDSDAAALDDTRNMFCYFARFVDKKDRSLTALRRSAQFKGIVGKRLIRFLNDTLKLVPDKVFKLDSEFDLLIDQSNIHALRPSGLEALGGLQTAILASVKKNVASIKKNLAFIAFDDIESYAAVHPRAARSLASIKAHSKGIDRKALQELCDLNGVECTFKKGQLHVARGHELAFLEVLDRRRYEIELVTGSPERFRAPSRQRL